MPAGRPTKLTPEAIEKAEKYVAGGFLKEEVMPTAAGLALELSVNKTTLYEWAKDPERGFSNILDKCNQTQERILVANGLNGNFNSAICKLVLGKHGYHERQEHTGAEGKDLVPENMTISVLPVKVVKQDDDPSS